MFMSGNSKLNELKPFTIYHLFTTVIIKCYHAVCMVLTIAMCARRWTVQLLMMGCHCFWFKVKLSPKSNQGFIYDWIWVKPSCEFIITTKEELLRFTVVSFLGKLIFNGVLGHSDSSIKIAIFTTLGRLDTTWNSACGITRVSTHEHEHWEHCLCMQGLLKRRFLVNSPFDKKCPSPGRKVTVDLLHVRSHLGIETFCLPWRCHTGGATANVSCPKTFFLVNCAYTNNVFNARVHV